MGDSSVYGQSYLKGGKWCLVQWSIDDTVMSSCICLDDGDLSPSGPECNTRLDSPHLSLLSSLLSSFTWNSFSTPLSALPLRIISFSFVFSFFFFLVQNPTQLHKRDTQLVQENATMHLACKLFCVQIWVSVFLDLICCSACVFSPAFSLISRDECCPGWFGVLPASGVHAKR